VDELCLERDRGDISRTRGNQRAKGQYMFNGHNSAISFAISRMDMKSWNRHTMRFCFMNTRGIPKLNTVKIMKRLDPFEIEGLEREDFWPN